MYVCAFAKRMVGCSLFIFITTRKKMLTFFTATYVRGDDRTSNRTRKVFNF